MGSTDNKSKFGADNILAVSLALYKTEGHCRGWGLVLSCWVLWQFRSDQPVPAFSVLHDGSHAGNELAVQELMVLPVEAEASEKLCLTIRMS